MPSPLQDPGFIEAVTSPEFLALPWEDRRAKLTQHVPEFASSSKADQNNILGMIQKKGNVNPPVADGLTGTDLSAEHPFTKIVDGVARMAQPGADAKAGGASMALRGAGQIATPYAAPLALANPVGAALGVAGGMAGGQLAGAAAQSLGAPQGVQDLASDGGSMLGGGAAARLTPGLLSAVGTGARNLTGMTTGRGRVGIDAAVEGSPQFMNAMRGNVSEQQLADKVGAARDVLHNQTDAQYRQDYAALPTSRLPLAARVPTQIESGINGVLAKFKVKGTPTGGLDFSRSHLPDEASQNEIKDIVDITRKWGSDPGDYTPQGLDILKKQLKNKIVETGPGLSATTQMKNVVQNVLENHVPGYKEMTAKYAKAQDLIRNVEDEFSLEARNPGTAVRKVMGVQNQPNGNNYRADLLKKLDAATGTNVSDEALGMGFRGAMPHGLRSTLATGDLGAAGGAAFMGHPLAAAGLLSGAALTSPRLVGEGAAALGRLPRLPALPYRAPWRSGMLGGLLSLPDNQ